MKIITTVKEMQHLSDQVRQSGKTIGVVPTMGYLHAGHLSLVQIAKSKSDVVVLTIFVNPTQFGPGEDFSKYPRDVEKDKQLALSAGVDYCFIPSIDEMYAHPNYTFVDIHTIADVLEGAVRPGHFRGVATVVAKLFNITKACIAVFGQKDAQQIVVIQRMVKDLNFDIEIIVAPIMRELDGLAMSSRNVYLSSAERKESLVLSQSLRKAEELIQQGECSCAIIRSEMMKCIKTSPSATIDYVSIANNETLKEYSELKSGDRVLISLAVRIGATRLIDNTIIHIS